MVCIILYLQCIQRMTDDHATHAYINNHRNRLIKVERVCTLSTTDQVKAINYHSMVLIRSRL